MIKPLKVLLFVILYFAHMTANGWGFYAHKQINRLAVYTLPVEMFGFYKIHIDEITEKAVDADKRRYSVPEEAVRHYLDADHYEFVNPIDTIPYFWNAAVARFTEDTLQTYGILPWYLQIMKVRLVDAYKSGDVDRIIRISSDVGHYLGDLHVPLHSTENYDGQLSGQKGIHGLWESRLPELYSHEYDFFVGRAALLPDINAEVWRAFGESCAARDSVLGFERLISSSMSEEAKYTFETRGNTQVKTYSEPFCKAYHQSMNGMVERRMRQSIEMVGSFWYTCWVDAGQPNLNSVKPKEMNDDERKRQIIVEMEYLKGKILGREEAK